VQSRGLLDPTLTLTSYVFTSERPEGQLKELRSAPHAVVCSHGTPSSDQSERTDKHQEKASNNEVLKKREPDRADDQNPNGEHLRAVAIAWTGFALVAAHPTMNKLDALSRPTFGFQTGPLWHGLASSFENGALERDAPVAESPIGPQGGETGVKEADGDP
jgi:hypothetical protein